MSSNTISSYRDTFKLFLTYCKQARGFPLSIEHLGLTQIDELLVLAFLKWLEEDRNNGISTRNQRLACIHAFFRYVQTEHPVGLLAYQKILAIPIKKTPKPAVNYLSSDMLQLILVQPNISKRSGRRDLTLIGRYLLTGSEEK
ncbi:MAG: phage-specific recombinase/integrase XerD [Paenibacillus sp.]|nr:phage-specific recombinase/integrase XerD [Paenibacillus sp.]